MTDVRRILALRRASEAPMMALLLAPRMERVDAGRIRMHGASAWGALGVSELACLADLALGGAIRHRAGGDAPLATVTLTLQLDRPCEEAEVTVETVNHSVDGPFANAFGTLHTPAGPLGGCLATFSTDRGRADAPPLPWEFPYDDPAPLAPEAFTADERALADVLGPRTSDTLEQRLLRQAGDVASGHVSPGLALVNRSGRLQGGAVAGLAVAVAAARSDTPRRLLAVHVDYLRPGSPTPVRIDLETTRAGRRSEVVRATVSQGEPIVTADVTLVS